jgi:hypothetical protein
VVLSLLAQHHLNPIPNLLLVSWEQASVEALPLGVGVAAVLAHCRCLNPNQQPQLSGPASVGVEAPFQRVSQGHYLNQILNPLLVFLAPAWEAELPSAVAVGPS